MSTVISTNPQPQNTKIITGGSIFTNEQVAELKALQKHDETQIQSISGIADWLPRLQLCTSKTKLASAGKVQNNDYALIKSETEFTNLGKEVDVIVLGVRPKALDTSGNQVIACYDIHSETFKKIRQTADTVQNSGCMYGPEYLVYIPKVKKFGLVHFNSKSNRREEPNMRVLLNSAATLKSKWIPSDKYGGWQAIQVFPCSVPLESPPFEEIKTEMEKFNNPPAMTVELAPEEAATEARER